LRRAANAVGKRHAPATARKAETLIGEGGADGGRASIREDDAHIRIDLDLDQLSEEERRAAIGVLQRTLGRLSPTP